MIRTAGRSGLLGGFLFPGPLGCLGHEALFNGRGGDPHVTHFAAGQNRLHPLQIHLKFALGDRGDVGTDTAGLLGFTTAPDDAALHGALAGQFTNSCHKMFSK